MLPSGILHPAFPVTEVESGSGKLQTCEFDTAAEGLGVLAGEPDASGFAGCAKTLTFIPGRSGTSYTPEISGGAGISETDAGFDGDEAEAGLLTASAGNVINKKANIAVNTANLLYIKVVYH